MADGGVTRGQWSGGCPGRLIIRYRNGRSKLPRRVIPALRHSRAGGKSGDVPWPSWPCRKHGQDCTGKKRTGKTRTGKIARARLHGQDAHGQDCTGKTRTGKIARARLHGQDCTGKKRTGKIARARRARARLHGQDAHGQDCTGKTRTGKMPVAPHTSPPPTHFQFFRPARTGLLRTYAT
jgi:hypothetical protein